MKKSEDRVLSTAVILKRISDDKTLSLFNFIAVSNGDREIPLKEMNLRTKQYYTRISGLLNAGLIKKQNRLYSLSLLGNVVHKLQLLIDKALDCYWNFKALESIAMSITADSKLPEKEMRILINELIHDDEIKNILTKPAGVEN
jgi:hypothetical protein